MQSYIEIGAAKVPALGFGTFRLQDKECLEGVEDALSIGYRHIDTAQAYANEEHVGDAIKNSSVERDDIFVTTKVTPKNFTVENFLPSVMESLKKLKMDFVDLLLIHWPADEEKNKVAVEQLAIAKERGYAKLIGVSNFTISQMDAARAHTDIFCNQVEYHPYFTQNKIRPYLREHNMMLTAYRPLADGKILSDAVVISLAEKYKHTAAQIVLRWFIQQKNVSAIPKAADKKHRVDNFNIFDFELSSDDMQSIFALDKNDRMVNPPFAPKWDD